MMTNSELTRARNELSRLAAYGQLVYSTAQELRTLQASVRAWSEDLGVEVTFDPGTPAELTDYLGGAGLGAVEGALGGALMGLILGALVRNPGGGMALGAALGGTLGAVRGVAAVNGGTRIRIRAWWVDGQATAIVEVL